MHSVLGLKTERNAGDIQAGKTGDRPLIKDRGQTEPSPGIAPESAALRMVLYYTAFTFE